MILPEDFRKISQLNDLPEQELSWLAAHCEEVLLEAGGVLFKQEDPATALIVILAGTIGMVSRVGGREVASFALHEGELTGVFPFSRMKAHRATGTASLRSRLALLSTARFAAMRQHAPALEQRLVSLMSDRIREFTQLDQQREKLLALGKLSAGLAHELNNPAAASRRAASQLRSELVALHSLSFELFRQGIEVEDLNYLTQLQSDLLSAVHPRTDALELSALEDALSDWLNDHDVKEGWKLAPTFAQFGVQPKLLDEVARRLGGEPLGAVLRWLEANMNLQGLASEIEESSRRISELVQAIKSYSYMDQAPLQEVDVHDGLDSTVTMLSHKLGRIKVYREYDQELSKISAYGSELNQVWTNLIDNAVDAMNGEGRLWLRTSQESETVLVEVVDSGPGIPPDVQARIFEPFFTTKAVGKGTGLGLDITYRIVVRRHRGNIRVFSRPGETRFLVRLPKYLSSTE